MNRPFFDLMEFKSVPIITFSSSEFKNCEMAWDWLTVSTIFQIFFYFILLSSGKIKFINETSLFVHRSGDESTLHVYEDS